jgi:hypothetical protein
MPGGGQGRMIQYVSYKDETLLETIMSLIDQELSEPYSIFTYRYFITLWPNLCFMVCSPHLASLCLTSQNCSFVLLATAIAEVSEVRV